jgi:hypothetical protein
MTEFLKFTNVLRLIVSHHAHLIGRYVAMCALYDGSEHKLPTCPWAKKPAKMRMSLCPPRAWVRV